MSISLILAALLLALVVAGTIGGAVWWVQRPLPSNRAARHAALPLFSNEQAVVWRSPSRHHRGHQHQHLEHDVIPVVQLHDA